jgi:hypothetical protein
MKTHNLTFEIERETKGTYRYAEVGEEDSLVARTLYLSKKAVEGARPEKLAVTIKEAK